MSVSTTYPGVYVLEVPGGVRTITGVATSITAFIGRTVRGPVNEPVTINSYGDFESTFGGLWVQSTLGYAVRDFFLNGGSQAVIVRLFRPSDEQADGAVPTGSPPSKARLTVAAPLTDAVSQDATAAAQAVAAAVGGAATADGATPATLTEAARSAANTYSGAADATARAADEVARATKETADANGATVATVKTAADATASGIGTFLSARVPVGTLDLEAASEGSWGNNLRARIDTDVAAGTEADVAVLFNLSVQDRGSGRVEVFRNVSVQPGHPRRVDQVLEQQSQLVRGQGALPKQSPAPERPLRLGLVPPGQDPFSDGLASVVPPTGQAADGISLMASDYTGSQVDKTGLYALENVGLFNLLCIPPPSRDRDLDPTVWTAAASYCEARRAMLLIDPPLAWVDTASARTGMVSTAASLGTTSKNAAVYFPRLSQPDPLRDYRVGQFAPCGTVAGVIARTDAQRGVWKAPAGLDATLVGVPQLSARLTDLENGELNPLGLNCLRARPAVGPVIWGARTLQGDDRLVSEWKYIPVRRLALYLEESLYRGVQWVVFEPNDEPLWAQIRLDVGAFMHNLFRQGAFQGRTPREAYLVKCDNETTSQDDVNRGIVNIVVGFAPLKPAEFVILRIQQLAGQVGA